MGRVKQLFYKYKSQKQVEELNKNAAGMMNNLQYQQSIIAPFCKCRQQGTTQSDLCIYYIYATILNFTEVN